MGTMTHGILLFYEFSLVLDVGALIKALEERCHSLGIHGRLRVSAEGVNGCLSGTLSCCTMLCGRLREDFGTLFETTDFKLSPCEERHAFRALKVWQSSEVCGLYGGDEESAEAARELVDSEPAQHLSPMQWHELLEGGAEDLVLFDVRNRYETRIGRFAAARKPPLDAEVKATNEAVDFVDPLTRFYSETPAFLQSEENLSQFRNKRVLMYCTGGVRCERASALLKKQLGPEDGAQVFQLSGGIQRYLEAYPGGGFFEGSMYVFDRRGKVAGPQAGGLQDCESKEPQMGGLAGVAAKVVGRCSECCNAWDSYQGRWPCGGCGIPLLLCPRCQGRCSQQGDLRSALRCEICDPSKLGARGGVATAAAAVHRSTLDGNVTDATANALIARVRGLAVSDGARTDAEEVLGELLKRLSNRRWRSLLVSEPAALAALRAVFERSLAEEYSSDLATACLVVLETLLRDVASHLLVHRAARPANLALLQLRQLRAAGSRGDQTAVRVFWRLVELPEARNSLMEQAVDWREALLSAGARAAEGNDLELMREVCTAWRCASDHLALRSIVASSRAGDCECEASTAPLAYVLDAAEKAVQRLVASFDEINSVESPSGSYDEQQGGQRKLQQRVALEELAVASLAAAFSLRATKCSGDEGARMQKLAEAALQVPEESSRKRNRAGNSQKPSPLYRWAAKLLDEVKTT